MLDDLIEYTTRNIFLTGKAGTGKTTFLNEFVKKTKKKYVIVAPTGIAAINAGGSTIHSLFTFPLNNFVPNNDDIDVNEALNRNQLLNHLHYRTEKRNLFRELELLIVDEVSMLRADVLDAIDFALRTTRRNATPFGGVQILLIGDLHQLPPVVKTGKNILDQYYASPFFFDAQVLNGKILQTYQLEKIYRQTDQNFIELLNQIRSGNVSENTLHQLNERFIPHFEDNDEGYIYLVSHNHIADHINQEKLNKLPGSSYFYEAKINGDFKNHQHPNDAKMELKVGTQVMFIRNDSSNKKAYYNGKIAEVTHLQSDEIFVKCKDSGETIKVTKEIWENKTYHLDKNTQEINQEIMGSYEQFPIKTAWAVTIHKSQGLTFDKVIIDAGQAFASGQVYVALSRCRSLEGIVLKSKIQKQQIFCDQRIQHFQQQSTINDQIDTIIEKERYTYALFRMQSTLQFQSLFDEILAWKKTLMEQKKAGADEILEIIEKALHCISALEKTSAKFIDYLNNQFKIYQHFKNNWPEIVSKSEKAITYFLEQLLHEIVMPVIEHMKYIKGKKGLKGYTAQVKEVLEQCQATLIKLKNSYLFDHPLYTETEQEPINADPKEIKKISSDEWSLELFQTGKTIEEIAKIREIKAETVFSHLAKAVMQQKIALEEIVCHEKIVLFQKISGKKKTLNEWKAHLPPNFEYHEIRLLSNYFAK